MKVAGKTVAVLLLLAAGFGRAAAQDCTGDCDAGQSVGLAELVRGVNIALGSRAVGECPRLDRSGDDRIAIDELLEAVGNSVSGCPSQRVGRSASSVALSSVRTVLNFGSISAGGGGGVGMSLARPQSSPSLQGGGEGIACETLACPLFGTEEICCFFDDIKGIGGVSITRDDCQLMNGSQRITVDGFYSLIGDEFDPCVDTVPPYGSSFFMQLDDLTLITEEGDDFELTFADYTEDFAGFGTSCFPSQFDPFEFGIRGDGVRTLNGSVQTVIGTGSFGPTFDSTAVTDSEGLTLDVVLSFDEVDCGVFTLLDGGVSVSDAITGVDSFQTYSEFVIDQFPAGNGTFFLSFDGDLFTDCIGALNVQTDPEALLELPFGAVCPVGGRIVISAEDEGSTTAVEYTSGGGVAFDINADGSFEELRSSCVDLDLRECGVQQANETCTPCSGSCGSGFECAECLFCDFVDTRCVPAGEFVFCGNDLYGNVFVDDF